MTFAPRNLKRILNLRDAGGYPCGQSCTLANGMIYRSGMPDRGTAGDLQVIAGLGLGTIVDLRPVKEQEHFRKALQHIPVLHLPMDITGDTIRSVRPFLNKGGSEPQVIEALRGIYRNMPALLAVHLPALFRRLAKPEAWPILVHCRGGKDRTGAVVALLQGLAGVSKEDMLKDYMLTNEFLLPGARRMIRTVRILSFGSYPMTNYITAYTARAEYLEAYLEKIMSTCGSLEKYVLEHGVSQDDLDEVMKRLRESTSGLHPLPHLHTAFNADK